MLSQLKRGGYAISKSALLEAHSLVGFVLAKLSVVFFLLTCYNNNTGPAHERSRLVILMIALYSYGCIIVIVVTALYNTGEYKMVSKEQVDRIVTAIEEIGGSIDNNSQTAFDTESFNMLAFIGENLWEIQNTLKKIEAKMK